MAWTEERVDLLKRLWKAGASAGAIVGELSTIGDARDCPTRSAVLGKVDRLRRKGHDLPVRQGDRIILKRNLRLSPLRKRKMTAPRPRQPASAALFLKPEPFVPQPEIVVPEAKRCGVDGLTESQCRWPIGDPRETDFHFCHHTRAAGLPYCEAHARRAYQPPEPRRRVALEHARDEKSVVEV